MKFIRKIKDLFRLENHEEENAYYDEYEIEDEQVEEQNTSTINNQNNNNINNSSKFRFPLIEDGQQDEYLSPHTPNEEHKQRKKSAVFYDVEQQNGVKLPSHLPQQSLVYDVEVSNIAELLAKRNKSHGKQSIVRYEQSSLRSRSIKPVTSAERQFLTNKPQREDLNVPTVNKEMPPPGPMKRFVPSEVPSPIHGFNKPKPIEELMPNLEQRQNDAKLNDDDELKAEVTNENLNIAIQSKTVTKEDDFSSVFSNIETEAEDAPSIYVGNESILPITPQVEENVEPELEQETIQPTQIKELEINEVSNEQKERLEEPITSPQQEIIDDNEVIQDLAIHHLVIENSTVHIEQLNVEQAKAAKEEPNVVIAQETAISEEQVETEKYVDEKNDSLQVEEMEELVQTETVVEQQLEETRKGSRIPFNVIMLESDKKKVASKDPIAENIPVPIVDWKGNIITANMDQETNEEPITSEADLSKSFTEQNDENRGIPFQTEQRGEEVDRLLHVALEEQENGQTTSTENHQVPKSIVEEALDFTESSVKVTAPFESGTEGPSSNLIESTKLAGEVAADMLATTAVQVLEKPAVQLNSEMVKFDKIDDNTPIQQSLVETGEITDETNNTFEIEEKDVAVKSGERHIEEEIEHNETETISQHEPELFAGEKTAEEKGSADLNEVSEPVYIPYEKPPTDFLVPPEERTEDWPWLDEQAEYLISALASHQVQAQIESIEQGPAVTQFEITVAQGTKVSKVRNLTDDIKLALAAKDIRIDAPIPGKRTIGIEIPNRVSRAVRLSEVTNSDSFVHSDSPLEAALGLDLSGKPVTIDLCKMPHGLIAGATGSGKSVCINSILVSLLYKADPNELKLMLIDPKMVELAPFNKIPHLVSPVITDVKAATAALKWAVEEMERRYELFMHAGVRDIKKFNQQAENAKQYAQKMPYILIVIDELADLMMMSPADVEEAICRITQKARACGIHLIVATQRPSVDVITGLIKSNIPTRIAFAVSSGIDSRTILDVQGAERLLGRGDMLYLGNGMNAPIRLQGTFVTDEEIEDIIAYVRNQGEPNYLFAQEDLIKRTEMFEEQDELFEEVCRFVYEQGTASTSSVQRNFHIGYNRAARLVEMLEKKGFVSEARGSKPREVFINESDLNELFS